MAIDDVKKSRGRPRLDTEAVTVRLSRDLLGAIDRFIAEEAPGASRPEAMRRLIELALKDGGK